MMNREQITIKNSLSWLKEVQNHSSDNHLLISFPSGENSHSKGALLMEYLMQKSNSTVYPIYGKSIKSAEDALYQLSRVYPSDSPPPQNIDSLPDFFSNHITQPQNGYLVWFDADFSMKTMGTRFLTISKMLHQTLETLNKERNKGAVISVLRIIWLLQDPKEAGVAGDFLQEDFPYNNVLHLQGTG